MKVQLSIFALLLAAGCESRPAPVVESRREPAFQPGAAALVYTPAVALRDEDLDLSRDGRDMYALAGVESTIIDTTWVVQDDRQRYDKHGDWSRFERRAVSTRVTVRQR